MSLQVRSLRRVVACLLAPVLGLGGCAAAPSAAPAAPGSATAGYPSGAPKSPLVWADLTPATLARAKAERRFIVLDGSAEWCHFCHVMEAETYHDPVVGEILGKSFIAVKVDVDARPDIEERYGAWGWPATVIFSPDAEELGKYRGYIPPREFETILRDVVRAGPAAASPHIEATSLPKSTGPMPEEELAWIERSVELDLEDYFDDDEGGWGRSQKAPVAQDNAWALRRAAGSPGRLADPVMREHALFTLKKQQGVLDPVWGGVYQYSIGRDWTHPHYEKLMPYQAGAIENYAEAYALTQDRTQLRIAQSIRGYVDTFLRSKEGGFYATQDADLNAHEPGRPFLSGHEFYTLDDAHRRALGVPRVDAHEYASDNGLAIAAYAALYGASCRSADTCDATALAAAEKAAAHILATHLSPRGGVAHDATPDARVLHLADNAAFAWGLVRLHAVTHDADYLAKARSIVDFMSKELADPVTGGFFASTADPAAVGVFATRRVPFEDNVMALRVLAYLAHVDGGRPTEREAIDHVLRAVARPESIKAEGRMIGNFLLALEETRGVRGGH